MAGIGQHLPASERAVSWNQSVQLSSMGRKANCDTPSYNLFPNVQTSDAEKKVLSRDEHRLPSSTSAVLDGPNLQVNSSHTALSHPSSSLQHLNTGSLSGSSGLYTTANPQTHHQQPTQQSQDWQHLLASVPTGNSSHTHGGANEVSLGGPVVSSSSSQQQSLLLSQAQHHSTSNGFSSDMSTANSGSTTTDTLDLFRQQQITRQPPHHPSLAGSGALAATAVAVSSSSGVGGGPGLPPPSQQFTKSVPPGIKKPTPLYSGGALDPAEFPSLIGTSASSNSRSFGATGGGSLSSVGLGSSGVTSGLGGSLTASMSNASSTSGRNYVTVMSRGATGSNEQAEFSIQQEDFPALPGSQNPPSNTGTIAPGVVTTDSSGGPSVVSAPNTGIPSSLPSSVALSVSSQNSVSQTSLQPQTLNWQQQQQQVAAQHASGSGDQHSGGNFPTGASAAHAMAAVGPSHGPGARQATGGHSAYGGSLPNGMLGPGGPRNAGKGLLRDSYGLFGLAMANQLTVDGNVKMLTHGINLHELGINMNSPELHYHTFISPFSVECFGRPQDIDYPVTKEYHMAHLIRTRLPPVDLEKKDEDTLFWLFYNCTGEDIQLAAAKELFRRDWRYFKQEQVWIAKSGANFERLLNGERGQYTVFNPTKWERTNQNFTLYYDQLDNAPPKFPNFNPYNISTTSNSGGGASAAAASSTSNTGHH